MSTGWIFIPNRSGSSKYKDPLGSTVSSQGALTNLQIFVRESLQNAVDNRTGGQPARVTFRVRTLQDSAKADLLTGLQFHAFADHARAAQEAHLEHNGKSRLVDVDQFLDPATPLVLLYVEDFAARGLIGPETNRELRNNPEDFQPPHCFLGLARNIGDNQKGTDNSSGGTHGFGKGVYWKHSGLGTVLFHSRLAQPYVPPIGGDEISQRLFGQARLPTHWVDDEEYEEQSFFGRQCSPEELDPISLHNNEACTVADQLGFTERDIDDSGTSILIMQMIDPDEDAPITDPAGFADKLRGAAERFYWPAIVDNDVNVWTAVEDEEPKPADPESRPELAPFIRAYRSVRADSSTEGVTLKSFNIRVPAEPALEAAAVDAKMSVAITLVDEGSIGDLRNKAALVRGSGMVVGYVDVNRTGLNQRDFSAVVAGGTSCPNDAPNGEYAQLRGERLLALAEPVTHDKWTNKSDNLQDWPSAKERIKDIARLYSQAISEVTSDIVRPTGEAAPELSKLFPFVGDEGGGERDMHIEFVNSGTRRANDDDDGVVYDFEIRVLVPNAADFDGDVVPDRWKVEAHFGFLGEGRRPTLLDKVPVRFTQVSVDGDEWMPLENGLDSAAEFEEAIEEEERVFSLRGVTDEIDRHNDSEHRYEVGVVTSKFHSEETE